MPRRTPPSVFFFLILPYGTSFGFVSIALPFLAAHRGISVDAISSVVALAHVPHGYKFLWAPLVDATLTRKTWFLTAIALVAAGTFATAAIPISADALGVLTGVVMLSQLGLTFLAMTCQALMGNCLAESEKGRAAGWYQAGVYVGGGAGGGAALWLSQRLAGWQAGAVLASAMLLSALPLRWVIEPTGEDRPSLGNAVRALGADLRRLGTSRAGLTGFLICLLPVGAGAASNLFGAMALSWNASAHVVELATGVLGGVASASGAMMGGWLSDRVNRRVTFAVGGAVTAVTAMAMALAPQTATAYVAFTLAYVVAGGIARAAFIGFVLETIGRGAVATKYSVFASLLNIAILYMTRLDGAGHKRWGAKGLLFTDAVFTLAGIAVLLAVVALEKRRAPT